MNDLTKNERECLVNFIEVSFINYIQRNSDVDNLDWVYNICSAYRKLKVGKSEQKTCVY